MADPFKSPFDNSAWSDIQKQFMDALMGNRAPAPSSPGWADAMEFWWRAFKPDTAPANDNVLSKMFEQCRSYYVLSQQFSEIYQSMQKAQQTTEDFNQFLNEQFQTLESTLSENQQLFNWTSFVEKCEQPAEVLRNFMSNTPLYTGDVFNELSPELKKVRERFLSVPGVGYSRETQEKMQEALRLWANYQDKYQEFHSVMSRLNHDALALMRKRLVKMHKQGESVDSMREIYNIWVDSNEKVYGEFVFTEEYAELNANLVNSLMAFKNKSHEINEDYLKSMNLPTSSSIQALEKRQYELRKQVRALEAEMKAVKSELSAKTTGVVKQAETTTAPAKSKSAAATRKPAKKRKRKTKAAESKSSQVVDFKQKKQKADATKKSASKSRGKTDEGAAGMIEIKF